MVIEDVSYNICDQRFHEFEIYKLNPRIKVLRRTLTELGSCGSLECDKKFLMLVKEIFLHSMLPIVHQFNLCFMLYALF